jgi:hypothetical protein
MIYSAMMMAGACVVLNVPAVADWPISNVFSWVKFVDVCRGTSITEYNPLVIMVRNEVSRLLG